VVGILSLFILSLAEQAWSIIKTSPVGSIFEIYLVVALWLIPLAILMWIVSAYDSFSSCTGSGGGKQRFKHSGPGMARRRTEPSLIPRSTAILALLLAISVGMQCIPKKYYLDALEELRVEALESNMEIIPGLIDQAMGFVGK
jgi:hypothetical protein